jgi:hypothetical protein
MTPEDRILCAVTRQELAPGDRLAVAAAAARPVDWERVVATAERHGVAPIAGVNLARCGARERGLPAALAERLELALFENAAVKERDGARLAAVVARLAEAGLETLLVKGAALDLLVYDQPAWAVSRDLDIAVRRVSGAPRGRDDWDLRRPLYREGIECDYLTHHDVTMNGLLPIPFERVWADARPVRLRGVAAWAMAPEDLVVALAVNACRKRYLQLKCLFALAAAVERPAGLDWASLAEKARDYRCRGIVHAALAAARATLGLALPAGFLAALGVPAARARLIDGLVRLLAARRPFTGMPGGRGRILGRSLHPSLLLAYASLEPEHRRRSLDLAREHLPPEEEPSRAEGGAPPRRRRATARPLYPANAPGADAPRAPERTA